MVKKMRKSQNKYYSSRRVVVAERGGDRLLKTRFRYQRNKNGFLKIVRKMNEFTIRSTGTLGQASVLREDGVPDSTIVAINAGTQVPNIMGNYDVPFSIKFRLDKLLNASDIQNLADKYQIKVAYIRLRYNSTIDSPNGFNQLTANQASNLSMLNLPYIEYIQDSDDSAVPTTTALREKMGVKFKSFKNFSNFIKLRCYPRPTREVFNPAGVASAIEVPSKPVWLDANKPEVEHYGIKGIIHNMPLLPTSTGSGNNNCFTGVTFDIALKVYAKDFQ